MKYLNTMMSKLVEDEFGLNPQEKQQLKEEMDEALQKNDLNKGKFMSKVNELLQHPVGVMLSIIFYAFGKRQLIKLRLEGEKMDMEEEFKMQYKRKLMDDLLNE